MARVDFRNRRAGVTKLPDGRIRVTRVADVLSEVHGDTLLNAEVWLAWGTADEEHASCRLIAQELAPLNESDKAGSRSLMRVYEEIPATAEVQVGKLRISTSEDGQDTIQADFIQFSAGTYNRGTIGTDAPPGYTDTAVLSRVSATDDGDLRRITRQYIKASATPAQIGDVVVNDIPGAFVGTHVSTFEYVGGTTKPARSFTYQYIVTGDGTAVAANWFALNATLAASGDLPTRYYVGGQIVRRGLGYTIISRMYYELPSTFSYPRADSYFFPGKVGFDVNIPIVTQEPQTKETTLEIRELYFVGPTTRDALEFEALRWASGSVTYIPETDNPSNLEGKKAYSFSGCLCNVSIAASGGYFLGKKVTSVAGTIDSDPATYPTGKKLIASKPVRWAGQLWKKTNVYVTFP